MGVWEDSCFNSLLKGSNRKFRLILSWILELSLLRNPAVQHSCSHRVWIRSRIRRSVPKVTYWCCYSYNCFPDQHCGLKMASLEILKLFQRVGFSQWVAGAGPRMASTETAELSDRLSEGIHRWTMRPLRGSGVSQLTTAPLVKFVFSWGASLSCVPLIIRAHAPRCPKTRPSVWLCSVECVCVRFMKKKKKKKPPCIFLWPCFTRTGAHTIGNQTQVDLNWSRLVCVWFGIKENRAKWMSCYVLSGQTLSHASKLLSRSQEDNHSQSLLIFPTLWAPDIFYIIQAAKRRSKNAGQIWNSSWNVTALSVMSAGPYF